MSESRDKASKIFAGSESSISKAFGFAARAVAQTRVTNVAEDIIAESALSIFKTEDHAAIVNFVASRYDKVKHTDLPNIMRFFASSGVPMTQVDALSEAGKKLAMEIIPMSMRGDVPNWHLANVVAEIEGTIPRIVKERAPGAQRAAESPLTGTGVVKSIGGQFLGLWKGSVVVGIGLPHPRFWLNNAVGDFSQMWMEDGLLSAAKASSQNVLAMVPFVGTALQRQAVRMGEWAAKKGVPALPGVTEALINPVVNMVWSGRKGIIRTATGQLYTADTMRELLTKNGILDTMTHEDFVGAFTRVTSSRWKDFFTNWQDSITAFGNEVQQRQRATFFINALQRGISVDDATRLTKRALYDWKNAISSREADAWMGIIPFYRFWKLSSGQFFNALLEPLMDARRVTEGLNTVAKGGLENVVTGGIGALGGTSTLNRMKQQYQLIDKIKPFNHPVERLTTPEEDQQYNRVLDMMYPSWLRDKSAVISAGMPVRYAEMMVRPQKRMPDAFSIGLPKMTALDVSTMWTSVIGGLIGVAQMSLNGAGAGENTRTPDWVANGFGPFMDMLGPHVREPIENWMRYSGLSETNGSIGRTRITPAEHLFAETFGLDGLMDIQEDKNTGTPVGASMATAILRMAPILGTQAIPLADDLVMNNGAARAALKNYQEYMRVQHALATSTSPTNRSMLEAQLARLKAEQNKNVASAALWFMARQLGVGPYTWSSENQMRQISTIMEKQVEAVIREAPEEKKKYRKND